MKYECSPDKSSNFTTFYSGFQAYWLRLFAICYLSQFCLDYYHGRHYVSEFWQSARYHYPGGIDLDIHDPYTDAFHKSLVATYVGEQGPFAAHPSGKDGLMVV